ncbi:MAG: hypothetical protein ABTQ32_32710 [Myxococcaceae bacterium]
MRVFISIVLLVTCAACNCGSSNGPDSGTPDSGVSSVIDGGVVVDAGMDAGVADSGLVDAGVADAGTIDAGVDAGAPDAGVVTDAGFDAGAPAICPALDAGLVDAGVCAPGTADCDSNPNDCETSIASDPMNCGRCGRVCGSTATCATGLCSATLLLDPDVSSNYCHAVFTPTKLYAVTCWGNNDLSELRTAPINPGSNIIGTSLVAYNNVSVVAMRGLTLDGPDLLFGLEGNPSRVFEVSTVDGGPITTRFQTDAGTRFDSLQVVDDAYFWFHNRHTVPGTVVAGGSIKRRGRLDTSDTTLVGGLGLGYNLQVTPTKLLWMEARTTTSSISLYEAPRAGGTIANVRLVSAATPGSYLIRSGDFVYWTEKRASPNGKLRRYEFAHPNAVAQDVVTGLDSPEGLATDGTWLYFKQNDAMYRVGMCGGTPQQLSPVVAAHDSQATEIYAVDSTYVYFVAGAGFGDSKIYRVAK